MPFIAEMVDAIVDRLQDHIADLSVEHFPDAPEQYALYHPTGAVLVAYDGSPSFGDSRDVGVGVQDREVQFSATLMLRNLRGPAGAHSYLDTLRLVLNGYQLPGVGGGGKLRPSGERLIDHTNGVWTYEVRFTSNIPEVEADPDEALPLLRQITLVAGAQTTEIPDDAQD